MEEQHNRHSNTSKPNDQSPYPAARHGIDPLRIDPEHSAAHKETGTSNVDPIEKTLADRIRQAEIWMIILTAIIAISTAANVIVFYLESEGTSKQMGSLSSKAGEIVGTMNAALSDSRAAINNAFLQNRMALEAANQQSRAALTARIDNLRIDQRAWISVGGVGNPLIEFSLGTPFVTSLSIINTGRTPARNVTVRYKAIPVPSGKLPNFSDLPKAESSGVIGPGVWGYLGSQKGAKSLRTLGQPEFDDIRSHKATVFIYGRVTYDDGFGFQHWNTYCFTFNPETRQLEPYESHNDMDKELR